MPAPGTNLQYGNTSFLAEMLLRKLGFKPKIVNISQKTALRSLASDDGTTFPRAIAICCKYGGAPATNTEADAPTGVGDICLALASNNVGGKKIPVADITVYRCTAYTSTSVFTWTQIV